MRVMGYGAGDCVVVTGAASGIGRAGAAALGVDVAAWDRNGEASSIAGTVIGGGVGWYSAGKAGVAGYTRQLAAAAPCGIRVNAIAPGLVETPRMEGLLCSHVGRRMVARTSRQAALRPDEVAAAVLFLLSPLASGVTGTVLPVDAGLAVTS